MVLIFTPIISEVKNIKIIGIRLMANRNINLSSLSLNFVLNFEIVNKNIIIKGIITPICLPKYIRGYNKWFQ